MLSMTGYGKGEYAEGGLELTCEIKTVNNRYLDVSVKAPRIFAAYEEVIRTTIRKKLTRGHADVFVSLKDKREKESSMSVDLNVASSYISAAKALKEAFRVLKPGGKLITSTGFVNKETLAALPEEAQRVLTQKRPDVFEDLYEDTVLAGFSKIDSVISGCWYTDDDESTIADLARSLGVNLKFTSYTRYCTKEQ